MVRAETYVYNVILYHSIISSVTDLSNSYSHIERIEGTLDIYAIKALRLPLVRGLWMLCKETTGVTTCSSQRQNNEKIGKEASSWRTSREALSCLEIDPSVVRLPSGAWVVFTSWDGDIYVQFTNAEFTKAFSWKIISSLKSGYKEGPHTEIPNGRLLMFYSLCRKRYDRLP